MKIKTILFALLLASGFTHAATLYVDGANGDDEKNCKTKGNACKTPWKALEGASVGDEIWITKGSYDIPESCHFDINKAVSFKGGYDSSFDPLLKRSNDASETIFTGNNEKTCRLFLIKTGHTHWLTFDTLTITGAASDTNDHGALYLNDVGGWLRLNNVIVRDTHMRTGEGAIKTDVAGSRLDIIDSHFENNIAKTSGGAIAILADADVNIAGTTFINNKAEGGTVHVHGGGAIFIQGGAKVNLTIEDSIFDGNEAVKQGGAIGFSNANGAEGKRDSSIEINRSSFTNNIANNGGGAIYGTNGIWHITNTTFSGNQVQGNGGAIGNAMAKMLLSYVTVVNNSSVGHGAGVATWDNSTAQTELLASIIAGNTKGGVANDFWIYTNEHNSTATIIDKGYNLIGSNGSANILNEDGQSISDNYRNWFKHKVNGDYSTQLVAGDPSDFIELMAKDNGGIYGVYSNKLLNGKSNDNPAIDAIPYDGFPYYGVGTSEGNRFTSLSQARASVGFDEFDYAPGNFFYFALGATNTAEDGYDASDATDVFQAVMDAEGWIRHAGALSTSEDYESEMRDDVKWIRAKQAGACSGIVSTDGRGMPRSDRVRSGELVAACDIGAFEYNDYYQLDCVDEDGMRPENNLNSFQAGWCFNPLDKDVNPMDVFENMGIGSFSWHWSLFLLAVLGFRLRVK